jgi:hypothetical protein
MLPEAMNFMLASLTEHLNISANVVILCPGAECNWRSRIDCEVANAIVALSGFRPWCEGHDSFPMSIVEYLGDGAGSLASLAACFDATKGPSGMERLAAASVEGHFAEWPKQRPLSRTPLAL